MKTYQQIVRQSRRQDRIFRVIGVLCTALGLVTLTALLADLMIDGFARIDWQFMTNFPSRHFEKAGILSAWVGSLLVILVMAIAAIPLGIAAGVYLEEYAPRNWFTELLEINVANLAGVPSIIFG